MIPPYHTSAHPDSKPRWYCVRTQPKREAVAASQIEVRGVEVFAPRIRFKRRTPRGKVWFEESLFPGYIFARFEPLMQRAVASAVGVRGLVKFAGECAMVPEWIIDTLRDETAGEKVVVIPDEPCVQAGDEAVVAEGALMGLQAVITQVMSGGERVKILLDMMGTSVEAVVPLNTLEKVA